MADIFEKIIKTSIIEFGINPLYCVSFPGYTWQCGFKFTGFDLKTLQDKDMILLLGNNVRGGIGSVMGDRYVKSDENKKVLHINSNNLHCWAMSQSLPYDDIKFDRNINLEDILNTPDDSNIGYFPDNSLSYLYNISEKTKNFPFCLENKNISKNYFGKYMKKFKRKTYKPHKKLSCD